MTGRDISALPALTQSGTAFSEPAITGSYSNSLVHMHSIEGLGSLGFVSHWTDGLHVLDLSSPPGGLGNDYPRLAVFDSSSLPFVALGDGAWDCHPHQPSGVIYLTDSEGGLFLLRIDRGHVNRYGPPLSNGTSVPRISAQLRPPRLGSIFVFRMDRLSPNGLGFLSLSFGEETGYLAGSPLVLGGVTVLVDVATLSNFLFFANSAGSASFPLPLPNLPSLAGLKLFSQLFELLPNDVLASSQGSWFGLGN